MSHYSELHATHAVQYLDAQGTVLCHYDVDTNQEAMIAALFDRMALEHDPHTGFPEGATSVRIVELKREN